MNIPNNHPRNKSLKQREKIVKALDKGVISKHGLIAHGRGETFDYLLGERTTDEARKATKFACKQIKKSKNPILSVNGNTAALVPKGIAKLVNETKIKAEVNLFHRSEERINKIINHLKQHGLKNVLGKNPNKKIPKLDHDRAMVTKEGIYSSDCVIVPLEDGDRTEKLKKMNKKVIAIDLNPLSRTAKKADITIVDNVTRAISNLKELYEKIGPKNELKSKFNNKRNLSKMEKKIRSGYGEEKKIK